MTNKIVDWILFGKLINKTHCEKVKYVTVAGIIALLYIGYMMFTKRWDQPIEYLYLALLAGVGGYLGVIYYKLQRHKPINAKTVILFFLDK
jgi:predicted tellurium resistance membrane protein TerC